MKTAIVVIFDKFEEMEAVSPIDILRRAGVDVCVAALEGGALVAGRSGIRLAPDAAFADVEKRDFDAFVISGGPGVNEAVKNESLKAAAKRHFDNGKIVAAICAAPSILKNAGVLDGQKCTSHPSVAAVLKNCDESLSTVESGNIITSRGAGTAAEFALTVAKRLCGADKALEIAKSICFL